ncbi:MAG TPA: hypothetical protein VMU37_07910 [Caulobacteraceae bacterium]|nr:hypothetical protein [Caulobacteraceae bacterium]
MEYRADVICCGVEGRLCRIHRGAEVGWYFAITRDPVLRRRFDNQSEARDYWAAIRGQATANASR